MGIKCDLNAFKLNLNCILMGISWGCQIDLTGIEIGFKRD